MKKIILLTLALFSCWIGSAQSTSPQVISSAGNHFSNGNHQISFTIGETVVQTFSNSANTLTQGFHQSNLSVISIEEIDFLSSIEVYPNPVVETLNIEMENHTGEVWLNLYSISGQLVLQKKADSPSESLNMAKLAEGVYLLKFSGENAPKKTYSIIKTD